MMNSNMMSDGFNCLSGGGWMMMGGMSLFWIILLVLLFVGINKLSKGGHYKPANLNAAEALDLRLAKGEISAEEYDMVKQRLN